MTTVIRTFRVLINAAPDAVFAYVSDLTRHGEWSEGLIVEAASSGPLGVGSQYRSRGKVLNQKDRPNEIRVTRYESPTRFAFVAQDPDFKEVTHEFTFHAQNGGTLMERTVIAELPPWVAFAFRTIIFPLVGKPGMDKALAALKVKLEQSGA